ncbi:IS5/IS1182 family transposase, partial [Xanthomonas oryzae pv. oryzae]
WLKRKELMPAAGKVCLSPGKYTENAPKTAKNQGFERPQRRRCGLLHFPAALIRPSIRLRHAPKHMPQPLYS